MVDFAIIVDSDSGIECKGSSRIVCELFNNFCKVRMLDLEYSILYLTVASGF